MKGHYIYIQIDNDNIFEKKKIINKLHSLMRSFSYQLGFKEVEKAWHNDPLTFRVIYDVPENYITPRRLLYKYLDYNIDGNTVVSFFIPDEKYVHTDKQYTYNGTWLGIKWMKYLKSMLKDSIHIDWVYSEYVQKTEFESIKNLFYADAAKNVIYDICCSASRMLTDEELTELSKIVGDIYGAPVSCICHYCETCYSYHKDRPYHVEIVYNILNEA